MSVLWSDTGLPELRMSSHVATADHEPRADLELAMDELEKRRLLYVAATRARDHLVVACHHKAGDRSDETYAGLVWNTLAERDDLWRPPVATDDSTATPSADTAPATPAITPPVDDRAAYVTARQQLIEHQRTSRITSATAVAVAASSVAYDVVPEGDLADETTAEPGDDLLDPTTGVPGAVVQRRRGRTGSAIGRAVHGTLEVLDLTDPTDIEAQVSRQCELESILDLDETVLAMVRSALASPAVTEAGRSRHHKEMFVAAPVGDRVIEGYIDLLIERPDGLVIVDYKTDAATSPAQIDAALARYELQGASYAVVLEAVTGRAVVDCRFVFCGTRGAVERSVGDLAGAMARVRESLTNQP